VSAPLLELTEVSKHYPKVGRSGARWAAFWGLLTQGAREVGHPVLAEISLAVSRRESLAIVGANGAGKSTLLKMISGVLQPSAGTIQRTGTMAALLELGAGFDPEYSGLDNLKMNAAMLGLSRRQVHDKLDDILAFADIGEAIHEPIKHYSSGMVVRLGFAVAAAVNPDLLITDEVLAVGDESFQKKCIRWIEGYLDQGGTLLMVSHNMYQVQKLCQRALWLEGGRARAYGDVFEVTQAYLAWHERRDAEALAAGAGRRAYASYQVQSLGLPDAGEGEPTLEMGASLRVALAVRAVGHRAPVVLLGVVRADGTPVYGVSSDFDEVALTIDEQGLCRLEVEFTELPLLPGGYAVRAHAMDPEGLRVHDTAEVSFTVVGRSREMGLVRLSHRWMPQ
jgi:lipopolysaccharide transport system ATP-binding protein